MNVDWPDSEINHLYQMLNEKDQQIADLKWELNECYKRLDEYEWMRQGLEK